MVSNRNVQQQPSCGQYNNKCSQTEKQILPVFSVKPQDLAKCLDEEAIEGYESEQQQQA
jgi:hypothetical protein